MMSEQALRLASGENFDFDTAERMRRLAKGVDDRIVSSSDFDISWYDSSSVQSIPFILERVDEKLGGIKAGQFGVIAGRPGIGKTTLLLYNVYLWWELNMNVFFVSREMTAKELMARFAGMAGGFNYKLLDQPWMIDPAVKQKLKTATSRLKGSKGKIVIPPNSIATPDDIWTHVKDRAGYYSAIAIDGLYLMRANTATGQSANWERVAQISNSLKQVAIDLNIPILAVTQLKRRGHEDISPVDLEDLAYADTIGQDADFVIGLSRRNSKKASDDQVEVDVALLKNRSGGSKVKVAYTIDHSTSLLAEENT
jgi:replicative DNA helicase